MSKLQIENKIKEIAIKEKRGTETKAVWHRRSLPDTNTGSVIAPLEVLQSNALIDGKDISETSV